MKKIVMLFFLSTILCVGSYGQEIISKKGEPFLPEQGDWAIGIDVAPFFEYVGNIGNGNTNNSAPTFDFTNSLQIFGKWFKKEDMAWRGRLRLLGINNRTDVAYVRDDLADPVLNPYQQVQDAKKTSRMSTTLGFGMEKRKGHTRLQGFWGGELVFSFSSGSDKYEYGNTITRANPFPTSYTFDGLNTNPTNGTRVTEVSYGFGFFIGVRPFIGAEYFLFPKMSIGGEFGYTIGYGATNPAEITSEYYDFVSAQVRGNTQISGQYSKSSLIVDNDNLNGSIKMMFHF